jgi:ribA/ribD-fused uncharacterized protein
VTEPRLFDPAAAIEQLACELRSGTRIKFLCFWGHAVPADGSVRATCLSQWYPAPFRIDGANYPTAEHYMMAAKARLFGDESACERILRAAQPGAAKAIGREIRGFDEARWIEHRFDIVIAANLAKFSQNPALHDYLLRTGEQVLVEASPVDRIWGIGLAADAREAKDPGAWQGLNLLGFALMEVRKRLREMRG